METVDGGSHSSYDPQTFEKKAVEVRSPSYQLQVRRVWNMFQVLCRLPQNTHAITRTRLSSDYSSFPSNESSRTSSKDYPKKYRNDDKTENILEERVAFAVFLSASAFNHSCTPNAAVRFVSESVSESVSADNICDCPITNTRFRLEVVVTANKAPGESELTVSYGPVKGLMDLGERRRVLRSQYAFHCLCAGCVSEDLEITNAVVSPNGSKEESEININCCYCSCRCRCTKSYPTLSMELRSEVSNWLHQCRRLRAGHEEETMNLNSPLTSKSTGSQNQVYMFHTQTTLQLVHKIQTFYQRIKNCRYDCINNKILNSPSILDNNMTSSCVRSHASFAEVHNNYIRQLIELEWTVTDQSALLLSCYSMYTEAAPMLHHTLRTLVNENYFPVNDVILGREYVKLAQLYFHGSLYADCRDVLESALYILEAFVDKNSDADWLSCMEMKSFLMYRLK